MLVLYVVDVDVANRYSIYFNQHCVLRYEHKKNKYHISTY